MRAASRKIIRELIRPFDRFFFRPLLRQLNGGTFCIFFNIRSFLFCRIKQVKLHYDTQDRIFYATDPSAKVAIFSPARILALYSRGVQHRIELLAAAYFLPQIEFGEGDIVVDCGANIGELFIYFELKKIPIDYIGIEPAPQEYKCLKRNTENYTTYNVGLWKNNDRNLDFFVSSEGADSSFIAPSSPIDSIIKIPARRLDGLLPNKQIKLLKLEAEGAEPEVLLGCENILDNIEYISADLGPERGQKGEMTLMPVANYLISRGFIWLQLRPVRGTRMTCLFQNRGVR